MKNATVTTEAAIPAAVKFIPMKLERNYRPVSDYTIVGHTKPEVRRKNAAGVEVVVEAEEFVKGEAMPAKYPGVGFANKFWAGTVLKLPEDEAKAIRKAGIGSVEIADD